MSRGRPASVECYISIGIKKATRKRMDNLCFNGIASSRGALVDMIVGEIPLITKKLNNQQRKMMRVTIIRKGKAL
jgi:hypothetical protein